MYVICVDFRIRPERVSDFMPLMRKQADNSLTLEPGCKRFDVCTDPDDASSVFLYEVYDDDRAFDAHVSSKHFKAFDEAVSDMVASKNVRVFELS